MRGMLVFGRGYGQQGAFFDPVNEWKTRLSGLVQKRRKRNLKWYQGGPQVKEPTVADVIGEMLGRGYSFIRKRGKTVEVITGKGVDRIVTNEEGIDNIESNFGVTQDSIILHRQGMRGNKIERQLGEVVQGFSKPEEEPAKAVAAKPKTEPKMAANYPEANAPHTVGADAPSPGQIEPYPVDVYIGLNVAMTPMGVTVLDVEESSPAAQAGFQIGDVITTVGPYHPKKDRYTQDDNRTFVHKVTNLKDWNAVAGQFVDEDIYQVYIMRGDHKSKLALVPIIKTGGTSGPSMHIPRSEIK